MSVHARKFASTLTLALLLAGVSVQALAQTVAPQDLGGRERERFAEPPVARAKPRGQLTLMQGTAAPQGAAAITLKLRSIRITGGRVFASDHFADLTQPLLGRKVSLQAVYDLAQAITTRYGEVGYVLSRAIVPAQELSPEGAHLHLEVVEGYIDAVEWPEALRQRRGLAEVERRILAQRPANILSVEREMLLLGDLPGLKVSTTLRPSRKNPGASVLVVEASEKGVEWSGRVDNRGTQARGPIQAVNSLTLNNLAGLNEQLTVSYSNAFPTHELQFGSVSYRQVLDADGLAIFASVSRSRGAPGTKSLRDLDFASRGHYAETGFERPLIRQRDRNLKAVITGFVGENYNFWNLSADGRQSDDRLRGLRVKLEGDLADTWNGVNQAYAIVSQGVRGLGASAPDNFIASRQYGRPDFTKAELFLARSQPLMGATSFYVAAYGQVSANALLVSEQCGFGGKNFGRAFDPSQLLGDHCFMGTAELRQDISGLPFGLTGLQLYAFADRGEVFRRSTLPSGTSAARFTGSSGGVGARLTLRENISADIIIAKALSGPRDDTRFFFGLAARY